MPEPLSTTIVEAWEDPFLFGASVLAEGKALASVSAADLKLSKNLQAATAAHDKAHGSAKKAGSVVGKRKLVQVAGVVEKRLNNLIGRFDENHIDGDELREQAQALMRKAWRDVFQAGLRAAGVPGGGKGAGKPLVYLGENDTAWLKSAIADEVKYLNRFVNDLIADDYSMPTKRRVAMYAASLSSFYDSARIIGMPDNVVAHWLGPDDKVTCEGCAYLFAHSPFTKFNLPTVPRAGMTPCLSNCRDKLLIRKATEAEVKAVVESHKFTREKHLANLRKIKSVGHL